MSQNSTEHSEVFGTSVCWQCAKKTKKERELGEGEASAPEREERYLSPQRSRDIRLPRSDTVESSPVT